MRGRVGRALRADASHKSDPHGHTVRLRATVIGVFQFHSAGAFVEGFLTLLVLLFTIYSLQFTIYNLQRSTESNHRVRIVSIIVWVMCQSGGGRDNEVRVGEGMVYR